MTPAQLKALLNGEEENFIAASTPGGIEAQEAQGQKDLCNSSKIPKIIQGDWTKDDIEDLGIVYREEADDIFVNVTLPKGWCIKPTEHSMWSELIDDKNVVRAEIFYKAAFYDRNAFIRIK